MRAQLERLGTAGVLGVGILVFCATFWLSAVRPAERDARALRDQSRTFVSQSLGMPDLQRFHALFPPLAELGDGLAGVYAIARSAGLEYQQGEYRIERRPGGVVAYRVSLPARGNYTQVRDFTQTVLTKLPTASIDALRFERRKAGDSRLETQLRLTLYYRPSKEIR